MPPLLVRVVRPPSPPHSDSACECGGTCQTCSTTRLAYSPDQERDESGRWSDGGGDTRAADEAALAAHAGTPADPIRCGTDVDMAARMLAQGKSVDLDQGRSLSTLIDKLSEASRAMAALGEKAPNYNLCNVSIGGTNLFCADNLGIERVKMPQLAGIPVPGSPADMMTKNDKGEVDLSAAFASYIADQGIKVTAETAAAHNLRATQSELVGTKVAGMVNAAEEGKYVPNATPIFVTKDDYIIDGHHRWAATAALEYQTAGPTLTMPVQRLDIGIGQALDLANTFTTQQGIATKGTTASARLAYSPDQPRDESGRFGEGDGSGEKNTAEARYAAWEKAHEGATYYHGTNTPMANGTTIEPPVVTGKPVHAGDFSRGDVVYLTKEPHLAERYAVGRAGREGGEPHVYEVRPIGSVQPDAEYLASGFGLDQAEAKLAEVTEEIALPGLVRWENGGMMRVKQAALSTEPFAEPFPVPEYPPSTWLTEEPTWIHEWRAEHGLGPAFDEHGIPRLTVTDDGRVGGYFFDPNVCLVDQTATMTAGSHDCWKPPTSPSGYARFHQQEIVLDSGQVVTVGVIGNVGGHASPFAEASAAASHYANPDAQRIVCRLGESSGDEHVSPGSGWLAGALVPGSTYADVALLRRCALSGDWRWFRRDALQPRDGYDCLGPTIVTRPGLALVRPQARAMRLGSVSVHPDYLTPRIADAEFTEELHPRDEHGKFTSGGGGDEKSAEQTKLDKAVSQLKAVVPEGYTVSVGGVDVSTGQSGHLSLYAPGQDGETTGPLIYSVLYDPQSGFQITDEVSAVKSFANAAEDHQRYLETEAKAEPFLAGLRDRSGEEYPTVQYATSAGNDMAANQGFGERMAYTMVTGAPTAEEQRGEIVEHPVPEVYANPVTGADRLPTDTAGQAKLAIANDLQGRMSEITTEQMVAGTHWEGIGALRIDNGAVSPVPADALKNLDGDGGSPFYPGTTYAFADGTIRDTNPDGTLNEARPMTDEQREGYDQLIREQVASDLVQTWAGTSNDSNTESLAMQEIAEAKFGLDGVYDWHVSESEQRDINAVIGERGEVFSAFLGAQYDATQEALAREGVEEVQLTRNMNSEEYGLPWLNNTNDNGEVVAELRPMSSFSDSPDSAQGFGDVRIDAFVPVERILSNASTGFGCLSENEWVVLGGKDFEVTANGTATVSEAEVLEHALSFELPDGYTYEQDGEGGLYIHNPDISGMGMTDADGWPTETSVSFESLQEDAANDNHDNFADAVGQLANADDVGGAMAEMFAEKITMPSGWGVAWSDVATNATTLSYPHGSTADALGGHSTFGPGIEITTSSTQGDLGDDAPTFTEAIAQADLSGVLGDNPAPSVVQSWAQETVNNMMADQLSADTGAHVYVQGVPAGQQVLGLPTDQPFSNDIVHESQNPTVTETTMTIHAPDGSTMRVPVIEYASNPQQRTADVEAFLAEHRAAA